MSNATAQHVLRNPLVTNYLRPPIGARLFSSLRRKTSVARLTGVGAMATLYPLLILGIATAIAFDVWRLHKTAFRRPKGSVAAHTFNVHANDRNTEEITYEASPSASPAEYAARQKAFFGKALTPEEVELLGGPDTNIVSLGTRGFMARKASDLLERPSLPEAQRGQSELSTDKQASNAPSVPSDPPGTAPAANATLRPQPQDPHTPRSPRRLDEDALLACLPYPVLIVRAMSAVYVRERVQIRVGPPQVGFDHLLCFLQYPEPIDEYGQVTDDCRAFLVGSVQAAVRRTGHRMCILWGHDSCTYVEVDSTSNSFPAPSGGIRNIHLKFSSLGF